MHKLNDIKHKKPVGWYFTGGADLPPEIAAKFEALKEKEKQFGTSEFVYHDIMSWSLCRCCYRLLLFIYGIEFSGKLAPSVQRERQQLLEEFIQAGEDWAESSIVLNNKHEHKERQRGIYKLLSREDSLLQMLCCVGFFACPKKPGLALI